MAQERAWRVDINDGVRVNVAPWQLAGLLTSDVLRPDDARKAIADRALARRRAALGARWRTAVLRLDGRPHPRKPRLGRAYAGAGSRAAQAGGEKEGGEGETGYTVISQGQNSPIG